MGEANGNVEQVAALRRQLHQLVMAIGGRIQAQVHGHVEGAALAYAHQLSLGVRRALEVQAAQHAFFGIRLIVLHPLGIGPGLGHELGAESFKKHAPVVGKYAGGELDQAGQGVLLYFHQGKGK